MKNNPRPVRARGPAKPAGTKTGKNRRKNRIYLICLSLAAIVLITSAVILKAVTEHRAAIMTMLLLCCARPMRWRIMTSAAC